MAVVLLLGEPAPEDNTEARLLEQLHRIERVGLLSLDPGVGELEAQVEVERAGERVEARGELGDVVS